MSREGDRRRKGRREEGRERRDRYYWGLLIEKGDEGGEPGIVGACLSKAKIK